MRTVSKCMWCGKILDEIEIGKNLSYGESYENIHFCSEYCNDKFLDFKKDVDKNKYKFLLLLVGGMIGFLGIIVTEQSMNPNRCPYMAFIFMLTVYGLTLIRFPYCTPQTNKSNGVKKAIFITRIIAIIFLVADLIVLSAWMINLK